MHPHGSSGPLRDKKGSVYEGGRRVPGIIRWPGHIAAGAVSDEPICGVDLLPTLCDVAGIEPPNDRSLDGTSFLPVFRGEPVHREQPLYWQYNRARSAMKVALRDGDWKLLAGLTTPAPRPSGGIDPSEMEQMKSAELTGFELYNLGNDISEQHELSGTEAETLHRLRQQMVRIFHSVRDEGPVWPAWEFARYEAQRIQWPDYWLRRKKNRSR
jgi:arylsulfatase A